MYGLIAGLALFVLATYLIIDTGGYSSSAAAKDVSVHDLTQTASKYTGEEVTTTGILTYSEEHGAYQITDDGNYAIIIRGYSDNDILLSLKNKEVRVTGRFGYDPGNGVYIEASAVIEVIAEQQ
jgi:hypothetical protein